MAKYDDDGDERRRGRILQDGERVTVRMSMRDADSWRDDMAAHFNALQTIDRDAARSGARFRDAFGRPAGNRPGFVFADTAPANDPRQEIYRAHDEAEANAWRTPPTRCDATTGELQFYAGQPGDPCMTDDRSPGRLVREGDRLVCRAVARADPAASEEATDSRPINDQRERLYRMHDWEQANLWRGQDWINQNRPSEVRR
jgi:hypothetical protein